MKRFNKILFVNDFNKEPTPAFERAVKLAKHNKALLTMVEIFEELPPEIKDSVSSSSLIEYQNAVETESINGINNLIIPFKEDGVQFNSKVLWGTPFIEIIQEVIRNDHDLVMVSPRKENKIKTMLFGNRIMHLMRKCPCPVWAMKPTEQGSYNKIMVAVDPNRIENERGFLNFKIMEIATSLAYREQSELHVVSCWKSFNGDSLKYRSMLSEDDLIGIDNETRNLARRWLDSLLEKSEVDVDELPCRVHLLDGEPHDLIPELSNKEGVDLVVMGTISRTGIPGLLIGNTAEKILQKINCSVLAIKPDGFRSPVKIGNLS